MPFLPPAVLPDKAIFT